MNKMDGLLEQVLARYEPHRPQRFYRFDSVAGRWVRTLAFPTNTTYEYIELNLTPGLDANCTWDKDVSPIVLRVHSQVPAVQDITAKEIPAEVYRLMLERIGLDLTVRLLHQDFMSRIDMRVMRELAATGSQITWNKIKKE